MESGRSLSARAKAVGEMGRVVDDMAGCVVWGFFSFRIMVYEVWCRYVEVEV